MLIGTGSWTGRGRFLYQGQSLGSVIELSFEVTRDDFGEHLEGVLQPEGAAATQFAIRILEDESGTFTITAAGMGAPLEGTAKLESEPNLAMLWSEDGTSMASVTLFATNRGIGCRGFYRRPVGVLTWELVITPNNPVRRGGNVVRLRPV